MDLRVGLLLVGLLLVGLLLMGLLLEQSVNRCESAGWLVDLQRSHRLYAPRPMPLAPLEERGGPTAARAMLGLESMEGFGDPTRSLSRKPMG